MGFKIIQDCMITMAKDSELVTVDFTGENTEDYQGGSHFFVLTDDKGEALFYGFSDHPAEINPLIWAHQYFGATKIGYKTPSGKIQYRNVSIKRQSAN